MTGLMNAEALTLLAAGLLVWVALVYLIVSFGVRRGELVWGGRHPRLLPSGLRIRSFFYAVALLLCAWVLLAAGEFVSVAPFPDEWQRSVGWVVTVFLGFAAIFSFWSGSRWERWFFGPILVFSAVLTGWLTFA